MKALTISQPFASLIATGEKWIENRTWGTDYRGRLAIHAGKGTQYVSRTKLKEYPNGCIIAVARLAFCFQLEDFLEYPFSGDGGMLLCRGCTKRIMDIHTHDHTEGPYCWVLEDVRRVEPFPVRGKQGLWEFDGNLTFL